MSPTDTGAGRPIGERLSGSLTSYLPHRSAGLKLLLVCALALLMAIPALFVYGVVNERTTGQERAIADVSERVGGAQTVLGPFLAVPYARYPNPKQPDEAVYDIAVAFAETGSATADVSVEEKRRGIYAVPVISADLAFTARFDPEALRSALPEDATPIWSDARLYVGAQDTRGLQDRMTVTLAGQSVTMEPAVFSGPSVDGYTSVPSAGVSLAAGVIQNLDTRTDSFDVDARFVLTGADQLSLSAFAQETSFELQSDWDHPSFTGAFLPRNHNASDEDVEGFSASWNVPYLARGVPGAAARMDFSQLTGWNARTMAVRFLQPMNPYLSVERALKYAAMFIGFVFLTYFLFEITAHARAHPAQYVLIGLAQSIFYLLLLAFAERIGFDFAFLIAAGMTVGLISLYSVSVFNAASTGLKVFGVLSGIYSLIYVLMRAEDHALLAGALASFAAIAITMFMTRNVDWYGARREPEPA